ncbi:hypothetical protein G6N74_28510 [Mesorhizobium sp. CGMCC 1.15528]|uniref:Uncharacterized protein n=1 Tax=Mesorhizobium zhangyense TaxID=1776730 RepID=A0A7C9VBW7_9HYPH|nr:hypothetical protein [Mesorhizobium zhangyense]NGN45003.1 hypothetical protein [Mesorhizobium zhangyense]
MAAIGFFLLVSGALWGIWWRIEGKVDAAKKAATDTASSASALASLAREELADHRLMCAQTYITKEGLRDVKDEIMDALHGVKGSIDHLGGRIDSMYSGTPARPKRPA